MSNVVAIPYVSNEKLGEQPDARSDSIASTIRILFRELSLPYQERVLDDLTDILRPIPAPRAGDVLGAVIHLLAKSPSSEWSVRELKNAIDHHGIEATVKEIYNALGYLTRKRKIQRTGHGRYAVEGMQVVTSDDLGGPPSRHEIDDT
jgi:hypothetical protein